LSGHGKYACLNFAKDKHGKGYDERRNAGLSEDRLEASRAESETSNVRSIHFIQPITSKPPVTLRVLDAINATDDGDGFACQQPLPFPCIVWRGKGWSAAP